MGMKNVPKIVDESIKMARCWFPEAYARRKKYQTFHFAFAWKRGTMIDFGQNNIAQPHAAALNFARMFGIRDQIKYPYLHAEVDLIGKLWGNIVIDRKVKIVSLRLNVNEELCNAKPCMGCSSALSQLGVHRVWYSDAAGYIQSW